MKLSTLTYIADLLNEKKMELESDFNKAVRRLTEADGTPQDTTEEQREEMLEEANAAQIRHVRVQGVIKDFEAQDWIIKPEGE